MRAGFPSPADDHLDVELDLHAHVVRRPAATYFVRAEGVRLRCALSFIWRRDRRDEPVIAAVLEKVWPASQPLTA